MTEPLEEQPVRPPIVTVLAVLTILWCVYTMLDSLLGFGQNLGSQTAVNGPVQPEWMRYSFMVTALIKLGGAVLLLQMKKIGFYIYVIGEAIATMVSVLSVLDMLEWANGNNIPEIDLDPKIFFIVTFAVSLGLTVVWIGGFASKLSDMQ